jgi:hypothetical protein
MGVDAAGDHAAAMKEHEARQLFFFVLRGRVQPVGNIAGRSRQYAVGASDRANCISFASDWRRSCVVDLVRSAGEAAAIMVRRRFASGSSGMAAPVNQGALQWWSTDPQSITIAGGYARKSLSGFGQ